MTAPDLIINNMYAPPSSSAALDNADMTAITFSAETAEKTDKDPQPQELQSLLPPTDMLYYTNEGNRLTTCHARVLSIQEKTSGDDVVSKSNTNEDSNDNNADTTIVVVDVCLDRTILHAQGGGQPTDFGSLQLMGQDEGDKEEEEEEGITIQVDKVLLDRATGVATHTGRLVVVSNINNGTSTTRMRNNKIPLLRVGDTVKVTVDAERRQILSECHTAGHVVDAAMAVCGKILKPSKGYHFLDGPYVEYQGSIPATERDQLLHDLQDAYCQLVHQDMETEIELLSKEDADHVCNRLMPNYFDVDAFADAQTQQIRVVTVAGYPCPCGGTHVARTGDLSARQWSITGIKSKKGLVRVKYGPTTASSSAASAAASSADGKKA